MAEAYYTGSGLLWSPLSVIFRVLGLLVAKVPGSSA